MTPACQSHANSPFASKTEFALGCQLVSVLSTNPCHFYHFSVLKETSITFLDGLEAFFKHTIFVSHEGCYPAHVSKP